MNFRQFFILSLLLIGCGIMINGLTSLFASERPMPRYNDASEEVYRTMVANMNRPTYQEIADEVNLAEPVTVGDMHSRLPKAQRIAQQERAIQLADEIFGK